MKTVNEMTEAELRETDVPWPKTPEELQGYIDALVTRQHDYGTCVYAMSMSALAAFYYVSHVLGVTGFQASCADMDFLKRSRGLKDGFRIVNYENMFFPQYCDNDHFPTWKGIIDKDRQHFADGARKRLAEGKEHVHENVIAHWEWLASLAPAKQ
jgi:hypothetical protein